MTGVGADQDIVLELTDVAVGYSGNAVSRALNLTVSRGQIVALLGRNGAGKTTTLHTIAGILPPISGKIRINGQAPAASFHRRARTGLALVTEERAIVRRLRAIDNLRLSGCDVDLAFEMFPELTEVKNRKTASLLSGGQQQMLALGSLLAKHPKILLIDELSFGLAPIIVTRLLDAVRLAASVGTGVLLVEQQPAAALSVADHAYVMAGGQISASGPASEFTVEQLEQLYLAGVAG